MNKIFKVGTGLASAVAALAMAFPVYALITNADVAANAGIQYSKLSLGGKVTSANIKDGTITGKDIKGSTIKSGDIKNETIQSEDIKDGTIVAADLAAGTVSEASLADGSVTSAKIALDTIAAVDIAAGGVATSEILDGTILTGDISADTILAGNIAAGAVATSEILDGTILVGDLADGAVTTGKILDGTILTGDISVDTILAVDIADGAVATGEILDGTVASVDIALDTIAAVDIAAGGVATSEILDETILSADIFDGTITAADLGADSVAASEIADDAVGAGEIATSAVTTTEILDGTIAAADIASGAVTAVKLQSAAADLGAANVTVNLGNTNGAFVTNVTTDGDVTALGLYTSGGAVDATVLGTLLHIGETFATGGIILDQATTVDGLLSANGGIAVDTTNFTVNGTTGSVVTAGDMTINGGELNITGVVSSASTTEGTVYYDTDDDNLYVYANGAFVDLTAGAGGAITLDDAYNTSAGASTVLVDNGDLTLRSNAGATGDIIVDLNSTGDFILQDAGVDVVTFSDTGNLTMASGTLALNGDVVTSDGGLALTGATGFTAIATIGDASLIASAASVVIRGVQAAANAILLDADNNAAGGIDMDAGTGGITVDTTGVLSLDAAGATNLTTSVGNLSLISSAGSAILTGAEAVASAIDINATAGGADIDVVTQFTVDVSAATGASNISVAANADAEDLTIATTGTEGDVIINTADDFALGVAAGAVVDIADSAVAKTIDIGGVTASGTDTISIATEGTAADVIAVGNANAATTLALTGGTAWSVTTAGLITTTGDLVVNGDNIDADGTLVVAGATGLTLGATLGDATLTGASNAGVTATAGDVTLTSGDDIALNPTDDIAATLAAGGQITVNATTTANTTTDGVINMDVGAGNAAVDGLNISLTQNDGATAATDATATEILLTGNDADGDMFGLTITGASTAASTTGTYEAGIFIDNADTTAASMTDGILITSSGVDGGVVDAVDVSAANITNAVNVGANNVTGTDWTILNTSDVAESLTFTSAGGVGYDITGELGQDFRVTNTGGSVVLSASEDVADAINIDATAGGIDIDAVGAAGQDIAITNTGGSVTIEATEAAADAIVLNASVALGGIDIISNNDIDITTTGALGEDITITNTGGSVNINSTEDVDDAIVMNASAGGMQLLATGAAGQDITLTNTGGSLNLTATEAAADAIVLNASTAAGGIDITSNADIDITTTGAATEDISITNTGGSVIVTATEAVADAVVLNASAGGLDVDSALAMDIDTAAGNIVLDAVDAGAGAILPEDDSEDDLGADATRWSTIFADTLNYSAALTDDNSANTTVTIGDSGALDTLNITANTAIVDAQWSVTAPGVATFAGINGPVGTVTPAAGTFTTLIGDTVQSDTTVSFVTNGDSVNNAADATFDFTRNDAGIVTLTASDDDATAALTVTPGGAAALTLGTTGAGNTTSITLATDGTGTGEVVLPDGAISTAEIADGTIADADTNGALTGAALAADTLVAGDIATGAVTTDEILNATIAGGDLAATIAITTSGTLTSTGTVDFSGANTIIDSGTTAAIPGTCTIGQLYVATDGAVGSRLMVCTATNTWSAN